MEKRQMNAGMLKEFIEDFHSYRLEVDDACQAFTMIVLEALEAWQADDAEFDDESIATLVKALATEYNELASHSDI